MKKNVYAVIIMILLVPLVCYAANTLQKIDSCEEAVLEKIADQTAADLEQVSGLDYGGGGGDPCSCPTTIYLACYTGDGTDPNYICLNDGASQLAATNNTVDTCTASYVESDSVNEYITWVDPNILDDRHGTICFNLRLADKDADSDIGNCLLIESYADSENRLLVQTNGAADSIQFTFEGNTVLDTMTSTVDPNFDEDYRVCVAWTTDLANPDYSISVTLDGAGTSWENGNEDPVVWDPNHPVDDFTIGEKDSGLSTNERWRIWDVWISNVFQDTDPDP